MISAKYLGELVRLALQKLVKSGQLFGGKSSAMFARIGAFESSYIYIIEGRFVMITGTYPPSQIFTISLYIPLHTCTYARMHANTHTRMHTCTHTCTHTHTHTHTNSDTKQCKKLLKKNFDLDASDEDCEVARRVCEAVSTRAARLAAAGIVALVRKIDKLDKCTVAVDGSLYKLHPKFSERYIRLCVNNHGYVLSLILYPQARIGGAWGAPSELSKRKT